MRKYKRFWLKWPIVWTIQPKEIKSEALCPIKRSNSTNRVSKTSVSSPSSKESSMSNRSCHWSKLKVFYSSLTHASTSSLTTICTTNPWLTTRYQVTPNFSSADLSYSRSACNWKWRKLTGCRAKQKKSHFCFAFRAKKKGIKSTQVSVNTCLEHVRQSQQISKFILTNGAKVKFQTSTIWTFWTRMPRGLP